MNKLLLTAATLLLITTTQAQNVGIGIITPKARLHVADSNVLFTGPAMVTNTTNYAPPASGAGSRMMWYPQKAAFRIGFVDGNQWDKDNIGLYSFASGYSTTASGYNSTSMGGLTTATGNFSTSMGYATTATGDASTSMGASTTAKGIYSTSMGFVTNATGYVSTSMGYYTTATGTVSTSMGVETKAKSDYSLVIGRYNDTTGTNSLFEIGNGTNNNARSNAMTVLQNGDIGMGTVAPTAYGHGGTNRIVEIKNTAPAGNDIQSHLILSSSGTGSSLGGITWASTSLAGEQRTGFIGNVYETANQTKLSFYTRSNASAFAERFNIQGNGNAWLQGTLTQNSDARLKANIEPLSNALNNLLQLNGYSYNWIDENKDTASQIGVMAQQVQKVYPQLVKEAADGTLSVNYMGMVPPIIEAIKQQQKEIERLNKENVELKKALMATDEKLNALEQKINVLINAATKNK